MPMHAYGLHADSKSTRLPLQVVTIDAHFLDAREKDFYEAIYTQSRAQFGSYVDAGTLLQR